MGVPGETEPPARPQTPPRPGCSHSLGPRGDEPPEQVSCRENQGDARGLPTPRGNDRNPMESHVRRASPGSTQTVITASHTSVRGTGRDTEHRADRPGSHARGGGSVLRERRVPRASSALLRGDGVSGQVPPPDRPRRTALHILSRMRWTRGARAPPPRPAAHTPGAELGDSASPGPHASGSRPSACPLAQRRPPPHPASPQDTGTKGLQGQHGLPRPRHAANTSPSQPVLRGSSGRTVW